MNDEYKYSLIKDAMKEYRKDPCMEDEELIDAIEEVMRGDLDEDN